MSIEKRIPLQLDGIDSMTVGRIERQAEKEGLSVPDYVEKIFASKVADTFFVAQEVADTLSGERRPA